MKNESKRSQMLAFSVFIIYFTQEVIAYPSESNSNSGILVKRQFLSNSTNQIAPKILKFAQNGHGSQEIVHASEISGVPQFTLKSDPVRVHSDFQTVDINVLNRQRDQENAKKAAIIKEDLQSRIKINEPETTTKDIVEFTETKLNPEEIIEKQAKVKEDIESRLLMDDGTLGYRLENERDDKLHFPVKRSDDDYYADEPEPAHQSRITTEPPKEEDSFFSIFESLFGSSDEDSQTKKKSKPEDEPMFKDVEDTNIKENIKTVGSLLKPLKPIDKPEPPAQNAYAGYQSNVPEYRIVNNFHSSQTHKQNSKNPEPKPAYNNFYRPTEKPFRPYKPFTTSGYEDYDLEEFMDKEDRTTKVKYVTPPVITSTYKYPTTTTTITTTTSTTARTTPKIMIDNKLKFPSIQKKNDFINRNRYPEIKTESYEKSQRPEIKTTVTTTTTTEKHYFNRPNHENKDIGIKTQKIQESPNFYNLINLPVRYSTKDTAIPLISTSYANTKIQGMGAHKYEKGSNGKYPNHKYDQVATSSTQKPNYWATKRTSTESTTSFKPSPMISKTTVNYIPGSDLDKIDYESMAVGMGPALGNYGSKTGVEIKTQKPSTLTLTTPVLKETTTRRNNQEFDTSYQTGNRGERPKDTKIPEKSTTKPNKEFYEEYDYDSYMEQEHELKPSTNENYPPQFFNKQSEKEYKTQYSSSYKTTGLPTVAPVGRENVTENRKPQDIVEYEYYDYDVEPITTTTTTTAKTTTGSSKYKIKYPSLSKDKIKTSSSEKVAVVVPVNNQEFYTENQSPIGVSASTESVPPSTSTTLSTTTTPFTTTTTTLTTPAITVPLKSRETTTTSTESTVTENEITDYYKKPSVPIYRPNLVSQEPAPVFEDIKEDYSTKQILSSTTKKVFEKSTTPATVKPVASNSINKDQESNADIVLVTTKGNVENVESEHKFSPPGFSSSVQKNQSRPGSYKPTYDYTTEFTVGIVQVGGGGSNELNKSPLGQGHFVASSISTNPYGDDEPFRPIPKPPGMAPNFQRGQEDIQTQPSKPVVFYNKRPVPTSPPLEETEPIHEPHEFIPSPQFHRPVDLKPSVPVKSNADVDYDFEGIQTEPKPGQYVIFSKPQLNPEMNENQLKRKPDISAPTKPVSNSPHYYEKVNPFWQESQKPVIYNPTEGQIYQSVGKPKPTPDNLEPNRPVYKNSQNDDQLSLELVPPKGSQSEKPFEGNFVLPEDKKESTVSYPRPHWEKNSKPSFLINTLSNKNDIVGNRHPHLPPQMSPTLIPPSSIPPRFRRPLQPPAPPYRKNFNEAGTNVKPKPNLPNILPQFRPNTKPGSGPYQRPPGYHNSNRRNGMNRYHEKEHGNFPYHIQHPEKDLMHREFEMEPEIIPKFITNRGKLPGEVWNSQGMQKRFGQGPQNVHSEEISSQPGQKILKRRQRTPVTTLQMLKQIPGVKTQKTQISREGVVDSSVPLLPPIYQTFTDNPKNSENVYIVYPARAPQKLHTDDTKVFIVSDPKSRKNYYNLTKDESRLVVIPTKKENSIDKLTNYFPYGFVKPTQRVYVKSKEQNEEENFEKNSQSPKTKDQTKPQLVIPLTEKYDKIDMSLHMQSNNQWNEVKTDALPAIRNPPEIIRSEHYRFSDYNSGASQDNSEIQRNPPSEYHTSIEDDSAFTLGAVMHTVSEGSRKGQVASIPLHNEEITGPKLNVNERISNGKIITVSMPLDVKQDGNKKESQYQFQAPFQPSSSLTSKESQSVIQGWTAVKNEELDTDDKSVSTEPTTTTFNFENFKPELIGGFKPIFELPEEPEKNQKEELANKKAEQEEEKEKGEAITR